MKVKIGSIVTLDNLDTNETKIFNFIEKKYEYKAVTTKNYKLGKPNDDSEGVKIENVPGENEITDHSPVGKKIIGRERGYEFTVRIKNKINKYRIADINNDNVNT